jgi:hypothetical protein
MLHCCLQVCSAIFARSAMEPYNPWFNHWVFGTNMYRIQQLDYRNCIFGNPTVDSGTKGFWSGALGHQDPVLVFFFRFGLLAALTLPRVVPWFPLVCPCVVCVFSACRLVQTEG